MKSALALNEEHFKQNCDSAEERYGFDLSLKQFGQDLAMNSLQKSALKPFASVELDLQQGSCLTR